MHLSRLDNEVFFKKAFTDRVVLKAFVKDIVGIEVDPDKIETEKRFGPKVGDIDFRYDIFAEDSARRVIIEIQKVAYDHNWDRFLHYHLQAITEQQRSAAEYEVQRTVYTIVVMTAPYELDKRTGKLYTDEVMISGLNPRNLKGIERRLFDHELIFLNPNYKGPDTPANYRDWLDLIYESIHSPENPRINEANPGVKRASDLILVENLTSEEIYLAKQEVMQEHSLHVREEGRVFRIALKMIDRGDDNAAIAEVTELDHETIEMLRHCRDD